MGLKKLLNNPITPTFLLIVLFTLAFVIVPYSSIGTILLTNTGLFAMIGWLNTLGARHLLSKFNNNLTEINNLKTELQSNFRDDDQNEQAIRHMLLMAEQDLPNPSVKIIYADMEQWLKKNNITKLEQITDYFEKLDKKASSLQSWHRITTLLGMSVFSTGSVLEIVGGQAQNSPILTKTGAGIFAGGFFSAAMANMSITRKLLSYYSESKLVRKMLDEEIDVTKEVSANSSPSISGVHVRSQ